MRQPIQIASLFFSGFGGYLFFFIFLDTNKMLWMKSGSHRVMGKLPLIWVGWGLLLCLQLLPGQKLSSHWYPLFAEAPSCRLFLFLFLDGTTKWKVHGQQISYEIMHALDSKQRRNELARPG